MRFLFAAFLFLIAVAGFSFLAKMLYQGTVESEFEEMANASLEESGLGGVTVRFNHHDASLVGYVDSEEERAKILSVLKETIPLVRVSEEDAASLPIRPTLPPSIRMTRAPASREILLEGVMGADGEVNRELFQRRLGALEGIEKVTEQIVLDPKQLPLTEAAELATLAVELLKESDEARLFYSDEGLEVYGQVSNLGRRDVIRDLAERVEPEKLKVSLDLFEPKVPAAPSEFMLTRNRFGIVISGRVASQESREKLMGILQGVNEAARITDRIEIDQTLTAGLWEKNAESLLTELLAVFKGEMTVEFRPKQIRMTGTTETEESYNQLLSLLEGFSKETAAPEILADVTVAENQNSESAEDRKSPELLITFQPGDMTLTGFLPDISFLPDLEKNLKAMNKDYSIQNELAEISSSNEPVWGASLGEFLEEAATRVETGVFRFSEDGLKMEGMTRELTGKQILQNVAINSVPPGYSIENLLSHEDETFPEPELLPEDREKLAEELKQFPIYFAKNSDLISTEERDKLKKVSDLLDQAGFPLKLLLTGFADNVGNAEYNRKLSLRRAESVSAALISYGIEKDRISLESKGEDVSSVSRADRWKSRRVEISLVPELKKDASQ